VWFPGAIDDIINEIKGGRFTLKATEVSNSIVWKHLTCLGAAVPRNQSFLETNVLFLMVKQVVIRITGSHQKCIYCYNLSLDE